MLVCFQSLMTTNTAVISSLSLHLSQQHLTILFISICEPNFVVILLKSCRGNGLSEIESELPWCYSGQESASQYRGHGPAPWFGKIPHAMEQLSLCVMTAEPTRCNS